MPAFSGSPERSSTVRAALLEQLRVGEPKTAHELSQAVGVREREIAEHLEHLDRTLRARGERLIVEPASCVECGFVFKKRERLTRPGACPVCGGGRVEPPRFSCEAPSQ